MQKYVIALYIRLSIEDYKYDSLSIENQSLVLHEYAASMPETMNAEITEFIDNGYSGTNFERPQVQRLIELVRANQIDCIIVKDFSRFGRNSIETGYFIERVFPLFHTRFISISDDFDSSKFKGDTGGMDVAFKYLISEYYSRDMSIKTKSAKYAKMQRGEYQSKICPYGYRKSADGRMEPDPEAATVVQLIFSLSAGGMNAAAITRELFRRGMTAHTGIAVLTLIKFLTFQAQSFCRRGAIHLCRGNKMDCTAAIAADRRNLYQRHPSLRRFRSSRLRGFLSFLLCFRPHGILQIVSILRGKRQHSALRDPQRDRAAQGFQAGDKLLCVEPVVPRRSAGQCNYLNGCRCADAIACALEYKALILKAQLHPVSGANA